MKVRDLVKLCDNIDSYTPIHFYDNESDYQLGAFSFKRDLNDLTADDLDYTVLKFYVFDECIDIFII